MSQGAPLRLVVADTFLQRLLGVHALGGLGQNTGLVLTPCHSIHTFFLSAPIDVVFMDAGGNELQCVHSLAPRRVACGPWGTQTVVELPAGYCRRVPMYLAHIQSSVRNTLT